MRSFFSLLEREEVAYLLISGQACVLYGASQFTEDVDLWVRPTRRDFAGLLKALAAAGARFHKLTPTPTVGAIHRGHGFHFVLPPDSFIDVMGVPPRVGTFEAAAARARVLSTDWGRLKVAAPEDLVLLKRTNRIADYEAISNLVRMRMDEAPGDRRVLDWALRNTFEADDLSPWTAAASAIGLRLTARPAVQALRRGGRGALAEARRCLALEMLAVQERGRRYWEPVLKDLRRHRDSGTLIPEGTLVSRFLADVR